MNVILLHYLKVQNDYGFEAIRRNPKGIYYVFQSDLHKLSISLYGGIIFDLGLIARVLKGHQIVVDEIRSLKSTAFEGVTIFFSGFYFWEKSKQFHLTEKVRSMAGKVTKNLYDATHLVTPTISNQSHRHLNNQNLEIFHSDWIDELYEISGTPSFNDIKATSNDYSRHRLRHNSTNQSVDPYECRYLNFKNI